MTDSSKFGGFDVHDSGPGADDDLPAPLEPQARMTSQQLIEALDRASGQADDDLLRRIGVSMASFIAEIDANSEDVAEYISQRLAPLIPLTHVDFRVRDVLESIASDGRHRGR